MRHFIFDTDWWTDCDDAVALRLLSRAARRGEIAVDGILIDACMPDSAASLTAFLALEGVDPLPPRGIDRAAVDFGGHPPYQKRLADACVPRIVNDDLEDAAALCVDLLRAAVEPIEIIGIGYMQVLAAVISAEPALFAEKVSHLWLMAGKWDEIRGRENNFARNPRARTAAHILCRDCPVPITFLGWEVGATVISGGKLKPDDPLHRVLEDHRSPNGRSSWDPMLTLLALTGDPAEAGYTTVRGTASVDPETGENTFLPDPAGRHEYVIKSHEDEWYRDAIDAGIA